MKSTVQVVVYFGAAIVMSGAIDAYQPTEPHAKSMRRAFAGAFAQVRVSAPAAEVYRLLGPPDDVRTSHEPHAINASDVFEVWGYGAERHLDFPVLGQVHFDRAGCVLRVFGGIGEPPPRDSIDEEKLRSLLRLVNTAPSLDGSRYDPKAIIRIVNALHPLGKEMALDVVREYLRVSPDDAAARKGLHAVLRCLFEVPENPGYMPEISEGVPVPAPPETRGLVPRFPVHLIGDVPLLLVSGYDSTGESLGVSKELDYFQASGILRQAPLHPTDKPLHLLVRLASSPKWYADNDPRTESRLRVLALQQLLRLTDSVYSVDKGSMPESRERPAEPDKARNWLDVIENFRLIEVRWDCSKNDYVRCDETAE